MKHDTSFLDDFLDKDIEEMKKLYEQKLKRKAKMKLKTKSNKEENHGRNKK